MRRAEMDSPADLEPAGAAAQCVVLQVSRDRALVNTHSGYGDRPSRGDDSVSALRAEVTLHHTATVLHVHGEIDACNLPQWRAILDEAIRSEGQSGLTVLDTSDVTFMTSEEHRVGKERVRTCRYR